MADMPLLRITQRREDADTFHVEVAFEGPGVARQTTASMVHFQLTDQQQEDIRWYLEDYLQFPQDPAPTIAHRIETDLARIGNDLFKALFQASDDARDLWAKLRERLNDTRVEIITSVEDATAIPWELIRDPKTDACLALRAQSFVRAQPQAAQTPKVPDRVSGDEPIRILLVICRPRKDDDVPFRSVATRLLKGLTVDARTRFHLDLLRPATFARLSEVLRQAKDKGKPYHIVHFDGHGMYADVIKDAAVSVWLKKLIPFVLSGPRTGSHGYLLFENPASEENAQPVDGPSLGKLLVETDVPVLVLNACRSAHADPKQTPDAPAASGQEDPHAKVRALGSLAQEVMDAGVAGVVAMRYNVYVVTAALFVADLYTGLTKGQSLGQAVTLGRRRLAADPRREIAFDPMPLQDWCVPVVYEASPIQLFRPTKGKKGKATLQVSLDQDQTESKGLDPNLPRRPDAGFFGRDETLLALDRAFDGQAIVLLHAFAGSGKTAAAAEFARWYSLTGGLDGPMGRGPVLFTSFENYTPLRTVLGHFGRVFGHVLEQSGINWSAITDTAQMRDLALQVLKQIPVLWIWDNVEPVTGFPKGTKSAWSDQEQKELVDFLRDARDTKARFLLTSRRDERDWLGDLAARIAVPPMPMQEQVQLARALAEKHGHRITDVADWRPLLSFTQGNPLTITVLVGQALRDHLRSKAQIEAFVETLRQGEGRFQDEVSEGRSRSLGASLSYGFESAFSEDEQKVLALLHFFQGFVDVDALSFMGNDKADWSLPELHGQTRDKLTGLLDRAAEIGLLTRHGGGYYAIHPALPWFFGDLFRRCHAGQEQRATRAFAKAMGGLGNYYHDQYGAGNRDVVAVLGAEEANLLHVRRLARTHGWWDAVMLTMQGLQSLYNHTGRRAEWRQLVHEIVPDLVDPATDGPLPGREDHWSVVTGYRVRLARQDRRWPDAQRLQQKTTDWYREKARDLLDKDPDLLIDPEKHTIRTLAVSLEQLGQIQREQVLADCVGNYKDALSLSERIGDLPEAAVCAFNLGHAYKDIAPIRQLVEAERWYRRSLELRHEQDRLGGGRCLGQLGLVARERFIEARDSDQPDQALKHINAALALYQQALDMLPANAVNDLAVMHNLLGVIYGDAGDPDKALEHYRQAIRYEEVEGDIHGAGGTRYNVALALLRASRLKDALEYAQAAQRNFETFGNRATDDVEKVRKLVAHIQQAMKG